MTLLTAVVQAALVGAVVYCAIRCVQDAREDSRFWRELRVWIGRSAWKP